MRAAVLLFPALLLVSVSAATQELQASLQPSEIDRTRQYIDELSFEFGPADFRLLEPLSALADQLTSRGQFDEAHEVLDRAAQIVRIQEGLYASSQYPFLLSKIRNHVNNGNWGNARELMQHSVWLFGRSGNRISDNLIHSLMALTDLHLRGVAEDAPINQSYHFRAAMWSNNLAVVLAERLWGQYDERLVPMLYKQVRQHYLQAKAVDLGGTTALKLRTYTGSGNAQSRRDMRLNAYNMGQTHLSSIRMIFEQQEQNRDVAIALSEIYLADWEVLFANTTAARAGYERGFALLLEAGIAPDEINQYFSHPALLPLDEFHASWDMAMTDYPRRVSGAVFEPLSGPTLLHFQEWSPSIPFLHAPLAMYHDDRDYEEADNMAIFKFSLSGLEEISRWNQGRFRTAVSAAHDVEIIAHNFADVLDREQIVDKIQLIRFRPKLVNGAPQMVSTTLRYQSALGF